MMGDTRLMLGDMGLIMGDARLMMGDARLMMGDARLMMVVCVIAAYQNALLQDMDRFLSPTDKEFDLPEFATPRSSRKKVKSTGQHSHSDKPGRRQENVPPQSSADKSVSNTEMATPRGSLARPKVIQKVKVMETVPTTRSLRSARVVIPRGMSSLLESAGRC
ncbi:hypothetical protein LSAT2_005715 [Lamellibrachia satsuma]|nr:hypothetical protein LSAT2_005715 [Lamellibrachia satsuma]